MAWMLLVSSGVARIMNVHSIIMSVYCLYHFTLYPTFLILVPRTLHFIFFFQGKWFWSCHFYTQSIWALVHTFYPVTHLEEKAIASIRGTSRRVLPCKAPIPHWTRSEVLELEEGSHRDNGQLHAYQDKRFVASHGQVTVVKKSEPDDYARPFLFTTAVSMQREAPGHHALHDQHQQQVAATVFTLWA